MEWVFQKIIIINITKVITLPLDLFENIVIVSEQ